MSNEWSSVSISSLLIAQFSGAWGTDPRNGGDVSTVLRSTDIDDDGHVNLDTGARRQLSLRERNAKALKHGDVLLEASGGGPGKPVGRPAWFGGSASGHYTVSNFFRVLRPDSSKIDSRFLLWSLLHLSHRPEIWRFQQQTTGIINLKLRDYLQARINVPPMREQRKIAEILDSLDDEISSSESILQKLLYVRSAVVEDLLDTNDVSAVEPLGEHADVSSGVTLGSAPGGPGTASRPYLRVANVQDGHLDLSDIKSVRVRVSDLSKFELRPGDVLMNEGGDADKLGRGTVWEEQIAGCLHQNHVFKVRCAPSLNPWYLTLISGSPRGKRYFLSASKQTTNLATINSTQIKAFPVPLRSVARQEQIVEIIRTATRRVSIESARLAKLRALKAGIISDLLAGHVRLPAEATG